MDPQQRHVLETSYEALFNAGGRQGLGFPSLGYTKNGLKSVGNPLPPIPVNHITILAYGLMLRFWCSRFISEAIGRTP